MIDLRSDTVTQPTPEMRAAIAGAEVGDDMIGIDPSVQRLQQLTAEILGKEAALFMPSGSMSNQIAVRIHCRPGDEFLCEAGCHIYNYEQAAFAQLSGVVAQTVQGEFGVLQLEQLQGLIRPDSDNMVRTRLVCLENTHNRGAGRIQPYETVEAICNWAHENGLKTHLDGARLFNAVVATGISAADWAKHFDTVSVCFSKGLGAPVGSALAGPQEMMVEARRHRKLFGGGMRQAGILAAAATYALEHNLERLEVDHQNAQIIAEGIQNTNGLSLSPTKVDTNLIIFEVASELGTTAEFAAALKAAGVWVIALSASQIRAVTHMHITSDDAMHAVEIIQQVAAR